MFPMDVFRKAKLARQFSSLVFTTNYQSP